MPATVVGHAGGGFARIDRSPSRPSAFLSARIMGAPPPPVNDRLRFRYSKVRHQGSKSTKAGDMHLPLPAELDRIGREVVDSSLVVHRELGPGLLESVYEACLCHVLSGRGLACERQVPVPVRFRGLLLDGGFRIDVLVAGQVVLELKADEARSKLHEAQMLTYLRLSGHRLGYLINFNVPLIKEGIRRFVRRAASPAWCTWSLGV